MWMLLFFILHPGLVHPHLKWTQADLSCRQKSKSPQLSCNKRRPIIFPPVAAFCRMVVRVNSRAVLSRSRLPSAHLPLHAGENTQ